MESQNILSSEEDIQGKKTSDVAEPQATVISSDEAIPTSVVEQNADGKKCEAEAHNYTREQIVEQIKNIVGTTCRRGKR